MYANNFSGKSDFDRWIQHGYEMGTTAAEILFQRILSDEDEYIPEVKVLTADLIVRGSSVKE